VTAFAVAALTLGLLAGPARADAAPDRAVLADLPFLDSDEINRVFIDLAPDGRKPLRLMLDTGATFSVATPRAARALGVRVRRVKPDPYRRKTILGRDLQFVIDDRSSDTASKTGFEYALLGGNFLSEYVVELDFPGRRVRFIDRRRYAVPRTAETPGEAVLPLEIVGNRPGVTVAFNGEPATVLLDTGAPTGFMLSGKLAERAGIAHAPVPGVKVGSALGPVAMELGEARRVRLGPFELGPAPVEVAPHGFYNLGFAGDSILGYDALAQFVVRIDYRNQRLWLRRDPEARTTFLGMDYAPFRETGVLLVPFSGGLWTYAVVPGSAAARRGVRPGDRFETSLSVSEVAEAIRGLDDVMVAREIDGVLVDTPLEAGESLPPVSTPSEVH